MVSAFAVFACVVTVMFGIFYLKARSTEPAADKRKNRDPGGDAGSTTTSIASGDNCTTNDTAGCDGGGGGGD